VTSPPATAQPHDPPAAASRWEDYIDIFFSPAELYRRRAHDRVMPPLLTLIALGLVFYFILLPANGIVIRASATDPQQLAIIERMGPITTVFGAIMVPLLYTAVIAATAALLWLGGRFAEIRTDYNRMMLIATYAAFVYLLSQVLGGVVVLLHGGAGLDLVRDMSFGPLRFVGSVDMNKGLMTLLRRFDIFVLWQAVLWTIGLSVLYNVSYRRAGIVAGAAWLLWLIPSLLGNMLSFGARPG
jgi:hypothetical protein